MSKVCIGSSVQVVRHHTGGGARWNQKWKCDVCGRVIGLAKNGKIRRHVVEPRRAP